MCLKSDDEPAVWRRGKIRGPSGALLEWGHESAELFVAIALQHDVPGEDHGENRENGAGGGGFEVVEVFRVKGKEMAIYGRCKDRPLHGARLLELTR